MLILKDEHAIDVLKSGNTGHLWHDFHAIGVHATDVGHPMRMEMRMIRTVRTVIVTRLKREREMIRMAIMMVMARRMMMVRRKKKRK